MANFRHSLILDMAGNIARRSRQYGRSLERFSQRGQRSLHALNRAGTVAGRGIDRLGNRYVALATGAAGVGAIRSVGRLERRFTRLGIQANKSAEDMDRLKKRIFEVANAPTIRIDPGELTGGIEAIVEKTGDLKFAQENIENIGHAIQATGATGANIGALISEFRKFGLTTREEVLAALNLLVVQGKAGAFTIANLAGQGERLASAFAATGRTGMDAVRQMGALAQVARKGTGSSEQAATALEAVLRTLQDADKIKLLTARGIRIVDPEDPRRLRDIAKIYEDIVRATAGNPKALSQVFDGESMRAFNSAAGEFISTGALPSLEKFLNIQADGTEIVRDSARAARDAAAAWQSLATSFQQFADNNLAGPVKQFADAINSVDPERVQRIMKGLAMGAIGFGGLLVASKTIKAVGTIRGAFGRKGKGGIGGAAAAAGMAGGIVNVRVVNWPAGGMGGGAGRTGRSGRSGRGRSGALGRFARGAGKAGRLGLLGRIAGAGGRLLGGIGRRIGPLAALAGMVEATSILTDNRLTRRQKAAGLGGTAGGVGGAVAGAKAGGALGLLGGPLAPVTVPGGALLGGAAGYLLGDGIGTRIGELLARYLGGEDGTARGEPAGVKVDISLGGNVPPGTRTTATATGNASARLSQGFNMLPAGP